MFIIVVIVMLMFILFGFFLAIQSRRSRKSSSAAFYYFPGLTSRKPVVVPAQNQKAAAHQAQGNNQYNNQCANYACPYKGTKQAGTNYQNFCCSSCKDAKDKTCPIHFEGECDKIMIYTDEYIEWLYNTILKALTFSKTNNGIAINLQHNQIKDLGKQDEEDFSEVYVLLLKEQQNGNVYHKQVFLNDDNSLPQLTLNKIQGERIPELDDYSKQPQNKENKNNTSIDSDHRLYSILENFCEEYNVPISIKNIDRKSVV